MHLTNPTGKETTKAPFLSAGKPSAICAVKTMPEGVQNTEKMMHVSLRTVKQDFFLKTILTFQVERTANATDIVLSSWLCCSIFICNIYAFGRGLYMQLGMIWTFVSFHVFSVNQTRDLAFVSTKLCQLSYRNATLQKSFWLMYYNHPALNCKVTRSEHFSTCYSISHGICKL